MALSWERAGLYLDKQIDKQSTLFHYRAEKLTTSTNSGSKTAASREEEEEYEFPIHLRANTYTGILLIVDKLGGNS